MDIGLATAGTLSPGARRAARVAWREVALFGLLACGLSWLCWGWWLYPLLLIVAAIYVPFTLGEEYGWRGYLLPRLLPLGEVRASALVGLLWAVWHLPLLLAGLNYPGRNPWLALLVEIVATIGIAFPF